MTVTTMKTKAEQELVDSFAKVGSQLPGNDSVAKLRAEAISDFARQGLPHRRVEEWKYTDLRALLREPFAPLSGGTFGTQAIAELLDGDGTGLLKGVDAYTIIFVDGAFVTSTLPKDLSGVEMLPFADAVAHMPSWVSDALAQSRAPADGVVALNTAYMSGGVALRVAEGITVDKPIHLVFAQSGTESKAVTTRSVVKAARNANVTIIETHIASETSRRQQNTLIQVAADAGAQVSHIRNLSIAAGSLHLANVFVSLQKNAHYKPFLMGSGDGITRTDLNVRFEGRDGMIDLGALTLARASGHNDTTMVIDHAVPNCMSRELYKCVLDDNARAVFQGKVIVRPDAQKTDGKQMARALLLSPDAEFNSKPELEIYADDVVCGHGTTSMELDEDLLFYMRARGIPLAEARALLVQSFIGEAIDKIEHEGLREALMSNAVSWLNRVA